MVSVRISAVRHSSNNTSNVRVTWHWGAFVQPSLPWNSNKYYLFWVYLCSLSYPARNAHAPYYTVICVLSGCIIFFHIILETARYSEKSCRTWNVCFDFLYNFCLKHFSFRKELGEILSQMCTVLHVKCPLFFSDCNETWIFSTDVRKMPKYQISWKSFCWSMRTDRQTDGRTDGQTDRQTDRQTDGQTQADRRGEADCRFLQICESR